MEEPRTDTVTWFHRMRVLETAFQFRFARLGQSMVDGIVVIPGTFTAMRRGPVEEAGGFPVGMNGEDSDVTMQIGRLGYRVVVDPRIRSYEDVPRSPGEFVEQRTRWARAGFHVYARHVPLRAGSAGPRVWFWTLRRGFSWFSIQAGLVAPIFLLELVITHPSVPGQHPDLPAALRGRRRGGARDQPPVRGPVRVLAQHPVVTYLVRVRVPAPHRHPGGGHLAAGPALPGPRRAGHAAPGLARGAGRDRRPRDGRRPARGGRRPGPRLGRNRRPGPELVRGLAGLDDAGQGADQFPAAIPGPAWTGLTG